MTLKSNMYVCYMIYINSSNKSFKLQQQEGRNLTEVDIEFVIR